MLAENGCAVALVARRRDRLQVVAEDISRSGGRAISIAADVGKEADVASAVSRAVEALGPIDILVNSAGVLRPGAIESAVTSDWLEMLNVNLLALMYTARAVIPGMRERGDGLIINVTSTNGRLAFPTVAGYGASKFGATGLSDAMRHEIGPAGIRVTVIEPGATDTEIADSIPDEAERKLRQGMVRGPASLRAEDVASAILYVAMQPPNVNIRELWIIPTKTPR
jgi:hypothetical protein